MSNGLPPTPKNTPAGLQSKPFPVLRGLELGRTPSGFQHPDRHAQLTGKILGYSDGLLRIATGEGEFSVKTSGPVPAGTQVTLEIYAQKSEWRANIAVLRQQSEISQALPQTPDKTPLKPGDSMTGILLTEDAPEPPPPMTPQQAAQVIEQMKMANLRNLPLPLPVSADILQQLLTSNDVLTVLQKLPPADQKNILRYLSTHFQHLSARQSAEANIMESLGAKAPLPQPTPAAAPKSVLPPQMQSLLPLLEHFMPSFPMATMAALAARMSPLPVPQNIYQVTILQVTPPGSPPPQVQSGQLQGKVELITPAGFPAVRTPEGSYILKTTAEAPVGSTITFTAAPLAGEALKTVVPSGVFSPFSSKTWPALQDALQALAQVAPQLAANIKNSLPAAPRFAPTALFFLAALRSGAIESWLGAGALDALRQSGKKDLADKLAGDFSRLSSQSKTLLAGDWRGISMPLLHDETLSQMQFYVRHQQDQEQEKDDTDPGKRKTTRFILNLNLSRMGELQLDGLMRQKQLDLVLRTREALPPSMRRELMQRYAAGLEQAGMQGGMSFQAERQNWVAVGGTDTAEGVA